MDIRRPLLHPHMASLHCDQESVIIVKGPPDILLSRCVSYFYPRSRMQRPS
jgi:hypothetical protein